MRFRDIFSAGGSVGMDAVGPMALGLVSDLVFSAADYALETLLCTLMGDSTSGRGESFDDDYHDGERLAS